MTVVLPGGMPSSMERLPRDEVGRPVPFFVAWVDGKPDFRLMDEQRLRQAVMTDRCWVCGARMQPRTRRVFAAGPMCLINGTSAEPPSHYGCAAWSVKACPFLLNPRKVRREAHMPEGVGEMAGIGIMRNPGVTALIEPIRWNVERHGGGLLFRFPRLVRSVEWYAEGQPATRAQVVEAIQSGLPQLQAMAQSEGPDAVVELVELIGYAQTFLPPDAKEPPPGEAGVPSGAAKLPASG